MAKLKTLSSMPKDLADSLATGSCSNATERSFAILEFVASKERAVTTVEIGEALGLPKASAYRLIEALEKGGLLTLRGASKGIVPGPRLLNLSLDVLRSSPLQQSRFVLETLAQEVGETCNVGTLVSNEIVYLDRVEARHWPLRLHVETGARVPLYCSAIGKLFLAFLEEERVCALIERLSFSRYTEHTITEKTALERELAQIRQDGVALDREEYLAGVTCIAAPIFGKRKTIRAGIAIQAPTARMSVEKALSLRDPLLAAASKLTNADQELG